MFGALGAEHRAPDNVELPLTLPMETQLPDMEHAKLFAHQLVSAGAGRVRRVVLIGSRARGDARRDSDFDLAVIVEVSPEGRMWGPDDVAAERRRLQQVVGRRADVLLTTTDQYSIG